MLRALEDGRSPILLTERRDHLEYFASRLGQVTRHMVVLQGGMGTKAHRAVRAQLAAIPANLERVVLATGRYIGEGFDDARLDTLFLALPVSWKGTLVQYTGRLHRLNPGKCDVRIFDYVDREEPMRLRMFERRLRLVDARHDRLAGLLVDHTIRGDEAVERRQVGRPSVVAQQPRVVPVRGGGHAVE